MVYLHCRQPADCCGSDYRRQHWLCRFSGAAYAAPAVRQRPEADTARLCVGGGTLLVLADTLARTMIAPEQLPVGVITALLGVPTFLFLLYRSR